MKRSQVLLVVLVFGGLLAGYLVERSRRLDPFAQYAFTAPRSVSFDALVPPLGSHRLDGVVLAADGSPADDVLVYLYREEHDHESAEPLHWTYSEETGRFSLANLPAGEFTAVLLKPGVRNTRLELTIPAGGEVVWNLLEPIGPLETLPPIQRRDLDGKLSPPVGLSVEDYAVRGYEVVLYPTDDAFALSGAVVRRMQTDAEGFLLFEGLAIASYRAVVLPEWALGGSWPVLDELTFEHSTEGQSSMLSLSLRLRTGRVAGVLSDPQGRAIEGALVQIWPLGEEGEPETSRAWPVHVSAADGSFLVGDLPAGRYRLRVRAGSAAREVDMRVRIGATAEIPFEELDPYGEG